MRLLLAVLPRTASTWLALVALLCLVGVPFSAHARYYSTLPPEAPPSAAGDATGSGTVTLSAEAGGQFFASGAVNGQTVRFVVDTGATLTTLSREDAQRVGLDFRGGAPAKITTANGVVNGWHVSLDSVSVGDTTVRNVDAIVVDNDTLPVALLGMSFLDRFDMDRQGATLVLRRR